MMKILHTADWHLGRHFEGYSLEDDHAAVLDQVFATITAHEPDVLIIAGDVFDRAVPPESAVRQFNAFLTRVSMDSKTAIVVIAGNHDSGDRIGAWATLSDGRRSLVRGPLLATEQPLIIHDADGPVAISGLPFGYELAARECFGMADITCPEHVVRAQLSAARALVPAGARWIVVAHAFVAGGTGSGCERPLSRLVGSCETVSAEIFSGAHYVALGHLHRPQAVSGDRIRYSGAPLAFTFEEETCEKSLSLVQLDASGAVSVDLKQLTPLRRVRTLRGTLADILAEAPSTDFIRPILTDAERLIDPMKRLRDRFPNACALAYARDLSMSGRSTSTGTASHHNPSRAVSEFARLIRGQPLSEAEARLVAAHLAALDAPRDVAA